MTKTALESQVAALANTINEQRRALEVLSADKGMLVWLPHQPHMADKGSAPYIKPEGSDEDYWRYHVLPVFVRAIVQHGINVEAAPGAWGGSEISLQEPGGCSAERYVIPQMAGDLVIELLNRAADFARECYRAGYADGLNITKELATGRKTLGAYEDTVALELACDKQVYKHYRKRVFDKEKRKSRP